MREAKGLRRLLATALGLVPVRAVVAVLVGHSEGDVLFAVRTHELRVESGQVSEVYVCGWWEDDATGMLLAVFWGWYRVEL